MTKKEIVNIWYETQVGHYKKCREKQLEFSDIMWKLYEELYEGVNDEQSNSKANKKTPG